LVLIPTKLYRNLSQLSAWETEIVETQQNL